MTELPVRNRRLYRALLRAWPRSHREQYGSEMEDAFITLLRMDRERRGVLGAARCWLGAALDATSRGLSMRLGMMIGAGTDASWGTNNGRRRGKGSI